MLLGLSACGTSLTRAQFADFMSMDLEELSYVRMTTLGRTENALIDYPAATTVLSNLDIRRTGATTLVETLRNVPGTQTARVDSFDYAVSIRGFNDNNANRLLLVSDGRSLKDGSFSGTKWSTHEMILADLDRIEVLRGPGASLWGANAMNGFINIVSKSAHDTLGTYLSAGFGDHLTDVFEARYGWTINATTAARVYAKTQGHDGFEPVSEPSNRDWRTRLLGTRIDQKLASGSALTVIGEWRHFDVDGIAEVPSLRPPYATRYADVREGDEYNLSLRYKSLLPFWAGTFTAFGNIEHLDDVRERDRERRVRSTLDLQTKLVPVPHHEILTGLTFERTDDRLRSTGIYTLNDEQASVTFFGAFLQDEIELIPERLRVTAGAKLEQNSYSGLEFQPSVRAIWSPARAHRVWVGWSQAARTPTRAENGVNSVIATYPPNDALPLPLAIVALGSEDFDSEELTAFEAGYRFQPQPRLLVELSAFYNDYHDLRGFRETGSQLLYDPVTYVRAEVSVANEIFGHSRGGELAVRWQARKNLLIEASHDLIAYDLTDQSGVQTDLARVALSIYTETAPRQTTKLRASWTPLANWDIEAAVRHMSPFFDDTVDAYTALDVRLAWRLRTAWEIALVGRDLLSGAHREYVTPLIRQTSTNIQRSFELRITWER